MGFRFEEKDAGLADGMRRIATEEVARAEAELADPDLPIARKVHQARKRTKRLRGLLRLLRPAFPAYGAGPPTCATPRAAFRRCATAT